MIFLRQLLASIAKHQALHRRAKAATLPDPVQPPTKLRPASRLPQRPHLVVCGAGALHLLVRKPGERWSACPDIFEGDPERAAQFIENCANDHDITVTNHSAEQAMAAPQAFDEFDPDALGWLNILVPDGHDWPRAWLGVEISGGIAEVWKPRPGQRLISVLRQAVINRSAIDLETWVRPDWTEAWRLAEPATVKAAA
jgi:hypothetical protein